MESLIRTYKSFLVVITFPPNNLIIINTKLQAKPKTESVISVARSAILKFAIIVPRASAQIVPKALASAICLSIFKSTMSVSFTHIK
jgi:hypothetical protein